MTTDTDTTTQSARAGDGETLAVPFGMALVPQQATFEMVSAFHEVTDQDQLVYGNCQSRWRAMLAAAPTLAPLTLETAEQAKKDRAHAEAYYRQAEQLLTANEQTLRAECSRLAAEATKSERRAVMFGDIVHRHVLAMRAAVVAWQRDGADFGMAWIANTLEGPGHLPSEADIALGAQALFDKEVAEHDAFRAAHPATTFEAAVPSPATVAPAEGSQP
ncbi:MAG TPA: hypothetical protein VN201_04725 [Roseateles sp.]|nr:hypothetical protein [Roseateles sp.]